MHSDNPARQALTGLVSGIYKATASFQEVDSSLPPLWQALKKLDKGAVQAALRNGADPNEVNVQGVLGDASYGYFDLLGVACMMSQQSTAQQGSICFPATITAHTACEVLVKTPVSLLALNNTVGQQPAN